ncbi:MAG: hypothetical protein AAB733_01620 [Patescibacteria group bacterium]
MDSILPSASELTEFLKRVAVFTALGAAIVKPMVDILKVIVRNRIGREIQGSATLLVAYAASVGSFFTILLTFQKPIEWRTVPLGLLMGFPMLGGAVLHNIGEKLSRKSVAPTAPLSS